MWQAKPSNRVSAALPRVQLRLLVALPALAAVLSAIGLTSGWSTNIESERDAGGAWTSIACGSPWAPDYADAERVDEQRSLGSGLVDACRNHNEGEALFADAMTPAGFVLLLTVLGVIAIEVRDGRRRAASASTSGEGVTGDPTLPQPTPERMGPDLAVTNPASRN